MAEGNEGLLGKAVRRRRGDEATAPVYTQAGQGMEAVERERSVEVQGTICTHGYVILWLATLACFCNHHAGPMVLLVLTLT